MPIAVTLSVPDTAGRWVLLALGIVLAVTGALIELRREQLEAALRTRKAQQLRAGRDATAIAADPWTLVLEALVTAAKKGRVGLMLVIAGLVLCAVSLLGGGTDDPPASSTLLLAKHDATARGGRATVTLRCRGSRRCRSTVELRDGGRAIGTGSAALAGGATGTVSVALNRLGRRRLARGRTVRAEVRAGRRVLGQVMLRRGR
ncbi:MAG TPA: hypothetical protein VFT50_05410 [Baekduia sp.]|nr:hypothetical protein [Baekduia sp.]